MVSGLGVPEKVLNDGQTGTMVEHRPREVMAVARSTFPGERASERKAIPVELSNDARLSPGDAP